MRLNHRSVPVAALVFLTLGLALVPGPGIHGAEPTVEEGFRLLREAENLGRDPFAAARQGTRFDKLVINFFERHFAGNKINKTFAGDEIVHGYRVGNTEIWIQKQLPNKQRSVDILVWDLTMNRNGRVVAARGVGMDHHSVHPNSPNATPGQKTHWQSKVATANEWTEVLNRRGIKAVIDMNPDNSFYWRDAARASREIDAFTKQKLRTAGRRLSGEIGRGVFLSTSARALGTSMAVLGTADSGLRLLEALKRFYRSPILTRTRQLLLDRNFDQARRYWNEKCVQDTTMHADCEYLRKAMTEASSLLANRTYTSFGEGMQQLYSRWEAAARR